MVSGAGRRAVVAAGVLAAAGAGAAVIAVADEPAARSAQATGGLAVSPVKIDRQAAVGATNVMTVANRSGDALTIAVAARPWVQSSSGAVSPNRRSKLSQVSVSEDRFTLEPGQSKDVAVALRSAPRGGSLYGALEIIGLPRDVATRKGVIAGYRLIGPIRLHAAAKTYRLRAGTAKVSKDRVIVLPIRNSGNTNEAVSGNVRLKGPLGTRRSSTRPIPILPGTQVSVALRSAKGLAAGSYTARVTLRQGSLRTTVTKKLRIRRG